MNYDYFDMALKQKGLSRRKLASMLGINPNTFLSALARKSNLDPDTILGISKILGVSFSRLSMSEGQWKTYMRYAAREDRESRREKSVDNSRILNSYMSRLNDDGQKKVIDYASDMTKIPEYTQIKTPDDDTENDHPPADQE